MEPKGARVTQFVRTCQGKKGVNKRVHFSVQNGKYPKTHEKSLVHAFANCQVVTTKRTPLHGGGVEVNWSYQFFYIFFLYPVHTLHTKWGELGCNALTVPNSVNTLFPQSFRVLTPPALSVFTPFYFVDSERPACYAISTIHFYSPYHHKLENILQGAHHDRFNRFHKAGKNNKLYLLHLWAGFLYFG